MISRAIRAPKKAGMSTSAQLTSCHLEELDDLLVSKDGAPEKPEEEALPPVDGSEAAAPELDVLPEEPDEQILSQQVEEWGELVAEDTLEILEDPVLAVELSEDPVRLYLKEIGQINLLDADSEFRLAARIEADRYIESLRNQLLRRQRGSSPVSPAVPLDLRRPDHFLGPAGRGRPAPAATKSRPQPDPDRSADAAQAVAER